MKSFYLTYYALILSLIFSGCNKKVCVSVAETTYYNINNELAKDLATVAFIKTYSDSLNITMNKVIGYAEVDMPKAKPESLMGNFFCDALMNISSDYFQAKTDLCIMNYGGLRIPVLSQGDITIGRIYELMPFDNFLVLMKIKGNALQEVLHHTANEGGWPAAGIKMKIINGKAENIFINDMPLDTAKDYQLLISDYMADGGDKLEMLKSIPYDNSGVFVRDAVISYVIHQSTLVKSIHPVLDNRIEYAE